MKRTTVLCSLATAVGVSLAACSGPSSSPTAPTSVETTEAAANADGSTLKATAPTLLSPIDNVTVGTRRPSFSFANAAGKFASVVLSYRIQILDAGGNVVGEGTIAGGDGQTSYTAEADLPPGAAYGWRVRAELEDQPGPFSSVATFSIAAEAGSGPSGPSDGSVGPNRGIGLDEAFNIIVRVHNELRFNLGSGSTRQSRVDFLWAAVAAVHYGHPRFNPAGGDPGWCVKDGGAGRPPSDDVLVRCGSREAWDLVLGAGANGYHFHREFIGRLGRDQNVYPPPSSALGRLGN